MVNTCQVPRSDNSYVSLPERLMEAMGRFQAQAPKTILGSVYVYDLVDQRTLGASCSVATLLGYSADAIQAMGSIGLASLIHPDDLTAVSQHYQRFTTLKAGEVITLDYRMKRSNGSWCWLRSQETPVVEAIDGFPLQILGIVQPIAQQSLTRLKKRSVLSRSARRRKHFSTKAALTWQE